MDSSDWTAIRWNTTALRGVPLVSETVVHSHDEHVKSPT